MLTSFWRNWRVMRRGGPQLDELLSNADPQAPLGERNLWMVDLCRWLNRPGHEPAQEDGHDPRHGRLRYALQVLERNPALAGRVAATVRSLLADNDPTALLCDTGVASRPGFWGEFWRRVLARLLPPPPNRGDMAGLFTLVFRRAGDAQWIESLDDATLARIRDLLGLGDGAAGRNESVSGADGPGAHAWGADASAGDASSAKPSRTDAPHTDAPRNASPHTVALRLQLALTSGIQVLTSQVRAVGLSQDIRSRLPGLVHDSPFFALEAAAAHLFDVPSDSPTAVLGQRLNVFRALLDDCRNAGDGVYEELKQNGVAVDVVYQIECMKLRLARIELLLSVWIDPTQRHRYAHLIAELIRSTQARGSIRHLAASSLAQLARRVMDRSADTGEHYIARDSLEYLDMLKASLGGGFVVAFTVYVKFIIVSLHLDKLVEGLLTALNYAGSFLVIQFAHFTLATKQPAMTGPALARRLDAAYTPEGREAFVDDTLSMIRSNAAAIAGNLAVVIPLAWAIQWIAMRMLEQPLIDADKARDTLDSLTFWGPTPLYAAVTGALIWLSSLIAGWADNWFALHRVHDVMAYGRRTRRLLGPRGAIRWAGFWKRNISQMAANVSLGLMLGLGPVIVGALGSTLEVRHVSLSAGQMAAAFATLGWEVVHTQAFWLAVAGTAATGVLNVVVSFALAFNVALRSRDLGRDDRVALSTGVRRRILRRPAALFWPTKPRPAPAQP